MERVDRLYEWLAQGPEPDCDQILAAALEHAEPPYSARIVAHLLQRATDAAWAGLIANYPLLPAETRALLGADTNRLRGGMAIALAVADSRARRHALLALEEHPCPRLAYLLVDCLRDPSDEIRKTAARSLRQLAQIVVDQLPSADWTEARRQEYTLVRAELAKALHQALHAFDLHFRAEVVEVSLWLTADLGSQLWDLLNNRRSQCASVLSAHLDAWNSPRLARFLLEALGVNAWRVQARRLLADWHTMEETAALLHHSELLADDEFCRRLGAVKDPAWFRGLDPHLAVLPADVRAHAPQWVCHLGFSAADKVALLSRWLQAADPNLQRACVHALAALDGPEALVCLAEVAESDSPLADLAEHCVAGRRGRAAGPVPAAAVAPGAPPTPRAPAPTRPAAPPSPTRPPSPPAPDEPPRPVSQQDLYAALSRLLAGEIDPVRAARLLEQMQSLQQELEAKSANACEPDGSRPEVQE